MVSSPWAIILCKVQDNQSEPQTVPDFRTVCERFFTTPGAGFNAVQFFSDMSHGSLDLSGSLVLGWYTLDVNVNDVVAPTDPPLSGIGFLVQSSSSPYACSCPTFLFPFALALTKFRGSWQFPGSRNALRPDFGQQPATRQDLRVEERCH